MQVNRIKDFAERVVWTFVQAFAASLVVTGFDDVRTALAIGLGAGAIAAFKVIAAQNVGTHDDGAAIPGGVIEP